MNHRTRLSLWAELQLALLTAGAISGMPEPPEFLRPREPRGSARRDPATPPNRSREEARRRRQMERRRRGGGGEA